MIESEKNLYDFGIIAGDNIYPRNIEIGGKETKHIYSETAGEISKSLTKLVPNNLHIDDTFLYVILGNHDEENECIKSAEIAELKKIPNTIFY